MGRGSSGAVLVPTHDGVGNPADSDQNLVARVRRGDDRAFELLYQRYHRRIHAYVLGMVKDHGRAEDVTQEVFVSALRRMRETEQPLAFKPWLYQIAKNSCIDAFRRSKRAEEVSYDADGGLAPADHSRLVSSGLSPDAAVAAKQDLDSLCGAFGGLSETHHEILVLRELEGLSYQEIGRRMGMSRPAVESTLFRARRRLTEEFDDIVSGARCQRIQGIIVTAAETRLGARDTRRLARHLAHCQSCRREALAAGLDRGLFARPSVRERVATQGRRVPAVPDLRALPARRRRVASASERSRRLVRHAPADVLRHALERVGEGRRGRRPVGRGRRRRGRRAAGDDSAREAGGGPHTAVAGQGRHGPGQARAADYGAGGRLRRRRLAGGKGLPQRAFRRKAPR